MKSCRQSLKNKKGASGYGSNADFVDYLLRVSEGKQMDGVTLKAVCNLLSELSVDLSGTKPANKSQVCFLENF